MAKKRKSPKMVVAGKKAAETRRKNEAAMTEKQREALGKKRSATSKDAADKAWVTMHAEEAKMTPAQKRALDRKRSNAASKAWATRRARGE